MQKANNNKLTLAADFAQGCTFPGGGRSLNGPNACLKKTKSRRLVVKGLDVKWLVALDPACYLG